MTKNTITVVSLLILASIGSAYADVDFTLDKNTYLLGDKIHIEGTNTESGDIQFDIYTPDNRFITTSSTNNQEFFLTIDTMGFENWVTKKGENPEGMYNVTMTNNGSTKSVLFEMTRFVEEVIIVEPLVNNESVVNTTSNVTNSTVNTTVVENNTNTDETEKVIVGTSSFVIGNKILSVFTSEHFGTQKQFDFRGENFTTGEILQISVTNSVEIINIQTTVIGNGSFQIPSIVDLSDLHIGQYIMSIIATNTDTDISLILEWTGSELLFVGENIITTQSVSTNNTTVETTNSPTIDGYNDQWFAGLSVEDKLGVISTVMKYLFS